MSEITVKPTADDMMEALSRLDYSKIGTGMASYSKVIHTDENYTYLMLVHVGLPKDSEKGCLRITTQVRKFLPDSCNDDSKFWFEQVYYNEVHV